MGVYFLSFTLEVRWGWGGGRGNFVAKHDAKPPASTPKQSLIFIFFFFSHTLLCLFIQVLYVLIFGSKLYSLAFVHVYQLSIIHLCECCGSNFLPGLFFSLCVKLIIIHYHTPKQRDIIFKPRMKLNHNMHS